MNFQEKETIPAIRDMVRNFSASEIQPHVMEWDEAQHFPRAAFTRMGELGLLGMLVPGLMAELGWATSSTWLQSRSWPLSAGQWD